MNLNSDRLFYLLNAHARIVANHKTIPHVGERFGFSFDGPVKMVEANPGMTKWMLLIIGERELSRWKAD